MKLGEVFVKARKRKEEQKVKILNALAQVQMCWSGAYDLRDGSIHLGCTEKDTPRVLAHEFMHKFLFENKSLEAGIMWDNISEAIELFIHGKMAEPPYVLTTPSKKVKSLPHIHKTLKEKGLSETPKEDFGLGITTYKSGEIKDIKAEAWSITKKITKEFLPKLKGIEIVQTIPTIGYWKGSKEPSSQMLLKGSITPQVREEIAAFKKQYNQDAVMLFNFNGKGWTWIQINKIKEEDIEKLGYDALTYDFERKRVIIMAEGSNIGELRKKVRSLGGNLTTHPIGVEFI
jgi:hypothetical protein